MMIVFPDEKESARQDIFQRVRFYANPYFVWKSESKGEKGLLFIQSDSTLAEMSLPVPILGNGRPITKPRSILMHFLTISEYDKELCRDDFELAMVREALHTAVKEYDKSKEVVVLMRFRCGHVSIGVTRLIPEYGLCKTLGKEYYSKAPSGAVQLNIDDM